MRRGAAISDGDAAFNNASRAFLFAYTSLISFQTVLTGTPVGTLKIQVSNDLTDDYNSVVTWEDMADSSLAVSGATTHTYNLRDISTKWIRIVYIASSGNGTINSNFYSIVRN